MNAAKCYANVDANVFRPSRPAHFAPFQLNRHAMLHFDESPPRKAHIEIIPMIDVMMFLLVFFVLISTNVIPAFGIKTTLPDSSTAQSAASGKPPVMISLQEDGTLAFNGDTVSSAELALRVQAMHKQDPQARYLINADQKVQWNEVVAAMDTLRAQGIEAITFATKKAGD
jgi:biopolymer transport protein ExbD